MPVKALYDREAAHAVTLRNLLERQGYRDLDEVRSEGRDEGRQEERAEGEQEGHRQALRESVLAVLAARGLPVDDVSRAALDAVADPEALRRHPARAVTAATSDEVFSDG